MSGIVKLAELMQRRLNLDLRPFIDVSSKLGDEYTSYLKMIDAMFKEHGTKELVLLETKKEAVIMEVFPLLFFEGSFGEVPRNISELSPNLDVLKIDEIAVRHYDEYEEEEDEKHKRIKKCIGLDVVFIGTMSVLSIDIERIRDVLSLIKILRGHGKKPMVVVLDFKHGDMYTHKELSYHIPEELEPYVNYYFRFYYGIGEGGTIVADLKADKLGVEILIEQLIRLRRIEEITRKNVRQGEKPKTPLLEFM